MFNENFLLLFFFNGDPLKPSPSIILTNASHNNFNSNFGAVGIDSKENLNWNFHNRTRNYSQPIVVSIWVIAVTHFRVKIDLDRDFQSEISNIKCDYSYRPSPINWVFLITQGIQRYFCFRSKIRFQLPTRASDGGRTIAVAWRSPHRRMYLRQQVT